MKDDQIKLLEIKIVIIEIRNPRYGLNTMLNIAEQRLSKLEDGFKEIIQNVAHRDKEIEVAQIFSWISRPKKVKKKKIRNMQ